VAGAVKTRRAPRRNTRMSSARNIASRSSFAQRSLRSRWKTASACTSGWKLSSCQLRNLLPHNKKEWSSYQARDGANRLSVTQIITACPLFW